MFKTYITSRVNGGIVSVRLCRIMLKTYVKTCPICRSFEKGTIYVTETSGVEPISVYDYIETGSRKSPLA